MKILFVSLYDARFGLGGAERVALDLAYAMKDRYRHEIVFCINPGDAADELKRSGIQVVEIPYEKYRTLRLILILRRVLNEFRPDVTHSHHRYLTFLLDQFFRSRSKILHTEEVFRRDKKIGFRYGHFAVACHESVRKNLVEFYGVPEKKTSTILNAVARPKPDPDLLEKLNAHYPVKAGQMTGLCIARMEEQKGHIYLIDAVALLPESQRQKIRIFLAGDGTLKAALMQRAREKGVLNTFFFLGYCQQIPEFLALCDFTLQPSLWEGSPLTLLLTFGAGKPVIASNIDGIRGVITPGKTGFLFNPRDAKSLSETLNNVLEHPEVLPPMSLSIDQAWDAYSSMDRTAAAYNELYTQLSQSFE